MRQQKLGRLYVCCAVISTSTTNKWHMSADDLEHGDLVIIIEEGKKFCGVLSKYGTSYVNSSFFNGVYKYFQELT